MREFSMTARVATVVSSTVAACFCSTTSRRGKAPSGHGEIRLEGPVVVDAGDGRAVTDVLFTHLVLITVITAADGPFDGTVADRGLRDGVPTSTTRPAYSWPTTVGSSIRSNADSNS